MIAGTLLVVLTGIFLPGILIEGQERKAVGEVQAVPAQYIASDSLLAKEASESLKLNDRIQLITGQWESETQEAYSYEMTLKDYEAAALARDSMEAIYQKGQYPSDLASSYANWYTSGKHFRRKRWIQHFIPTVPTTGNLFLQNMMAQRSMRYFC